MAERSKQPTGEEIAAARAAISEMMARVWTDPETAPFLETASEPELEPTS